MFFVSIIPILLVAAGGALGALVRYGAVQGLMQLHPQPFPLGTMLVNVAGCFAIGLLMARLMQHPSDSAQLFFVTGILGGFTTFSAFAWDALQLLQRGQGAQALAYVGGSVLLSLAAVAGGYRIGH